MGDRSDVKRCQDYHTAKIPIAINPQRIIKRVHNVPTLILRRHLALPMQIIDTVNDPVNIILMSKELIVKLLKYVTGVIDHRIAREPVKFHDGIRQLCTTRNNPSPEDLETIAFHD